MNTQPQESRIRIVVADDHFVVRVGLVALVNTEPDLTVIGEADDGDQAIALFERLQPDLVLMDVRMPGKSGPEATREIRARSERARVLILSAFDGDEDIHNALAAGASGYVLKSATGNELIPAIRAVAAGRKWIPQNVAKRLRLRSLFEELTRREVDVLHEVAKGLSNKQLADTLGITEYTAKDHLKNILAKLRVADRTQAVTLGIQRGILQV